MRKLIFKRFLFLNLLFCFIVLNSMNIFANDSVNNLITLDRVNFRTGASMDANVISVVSPGTSVQVIYNEGDWCKVVLDGAEGYMNAAYIGSEDEYISNNKKTVELVSWSEASKIFSIGVPAEIYDVRSGLTYYVKSFSNGNHADVEPITKEDTNIMHKTYNYRWSWNARPILVKINGRTLAASINGMPHGGGVNSNNGMNGQVCIHFKDSRTHNGNKSHERDHQSCVQESYNSSKY